jgi:pilus assembly protein CpaC
MDGITPYTRPRWSFACLCGLLFFVLSLVGNLPNVRAQRADQGVRNEMPSPSREFNPKLRRLPELRNVRWEAGEDGNKPPAPDFFESLNQKRTRADFDGRIEVVVGQSRLLTPTEPIASTKGTAVIAVGDPTVVDFDVLPNAKQMIRLVGRRVGVTDLTFVTPEGKSHGYEVHVVYDLELLQAQLKQTYPDALVRLGQLREHVIVEGQARSPAQAQQIVDTIRVYLASAQVRQSTKNAASRTSRQNEPGADTDRSGRLPSDPSAADPATGEANGEDRQGRPADEDQSAPLFTREDNARPSISATFVQPQIINLLQVPGVQQVMLKVQLAELDRRAVRQIGADLTYNSASNFIATAAAGGSGNILGVFNSGEFTILLNALRRNDVAKILAEPNLVTLSGHEARFQSGGEFPVPVAQMGGGAGNNQVQFKPFGVQLAFIPYIQDGGRIRLHVEPEVSTIDEALSVTLIAGGQPIPGLRTRNASTTVELREGQTLAIAGLLNYDTQGQTQRIPLLGDLPVIGALFANTRTDVLEQELLVVVTPYLVSPTNGCQRPPLPGAEIMEPNDLEFYLLNRIEGRTGHPFRSTGQWDNPFSLQRQRQLEQNYIFGSVGVSN